MSILVNEACTRESMRARISSPSFLTISSQPAAESKLDSFGSDDRPLKFRVQEINS